MRTSIRFLLVCMATLSLAHCAKQPSPYQVIEGVWYTNQNPGRTVEKDFSWGSGITVVNGAIEIDKSGENAEIFLPGMGGPFRITRLKWVNKGTVHMSFFFDRGQFEVNYRIHYKPESDTIWFEDLKSVNFILSGSNHVWYKISGPVRE